MPACYGVIEQPGGEVWVWLEEVVEDLGAAVARYGLAARHLGQFNGTYLVDQPPPTWPWLSAHWLCITVETLTPAMVQLSDVLADPQIHQYFPIDGIDRRLRLWAEREHLLDALDQLPHTICHLDAFSSNLFSRRGTNGDQAVAIDWAFVGGGAVGEELEPLICRSLDFGDIEMSQAGELDRIVFAGYLDGLSDAGWQGDPGRCVWATRPPQRCAVR